MQYVFEERLGVEYSITNDINEFINNKSILKIIYAKENIGKGIFFYAQGLLFEDDVKKTELHESAYDNTIILFTNNNNSVLNFDVFAAIFYLLSRYEEYLNEPLDKYGNYDCANSILFKCKVLDVPVIEQWIELLKGVLLKNFPSLQFKQHQPKFCLSIDIDVAFAYKNRSIARTVGGLAKKLATLNFGEAKNQLLTLFNKREDMFDTYNYIFASAKKKQTIFFFDMGDYGKFDKNPSFKNKKFQQLIKTVSQKAKIGLHPSYTSNSNEKLIASEKGRLEKVTGKIITRSRQHYLKLRFPDTYNNLLKNNINEDFTIGYSSHYGFRAGTCNAFLFFDLIKNESTNLRLFPFAYMEVTLNNYLKLNIMEAKEAVSKLIETVYKYNGTFIPIWHNSTLCDCAKWKNWRQVFEHTLNEIDNKNFENLFS